MLKEIQKRYKQEFSRGVLENKKNKTQLYK